MSERPRCTVIVRIGQLTTTDATVIRAICDRPKGHPGWQHKGRLVIGHTVHGIIEWPRVRPTQ